MKEFTNHLKVGFNNSISKVKNLNKIMSKVIENYVLKEVIGSG